VLLLLLLLLVVVQVQVLGFWAGFKQAVKVCAVLLPVVCKSQDVWMEHQCCCPGITDVVLWGGTTACCCC
jgi:hypothetical protein